MSAKFFLAIFMSSTSQYWCLLQKLAKTTSQYSTTLYYKACTNTSQYYFVLQSLHKALPSTTLYYKACTNYFPVLLCTTKLAQNTFQYYFVLQSFYTHQVLSQRSFYTQQAFQAEKLLHTEAFTHNKLLHREAFTHSKLSHTASVYTQNTYAQCFYTWQAFTHTQKLLHRDAFTHREAFTHSKLLQKKFLHREAFLYIITTGIAAPKLDLDAKATKRRYKDDFEALFKENFKRNIISAAKDNSITHAAAAPSNLDAATTMRSAEAELQNTIDLRAMASEIAAPKPDGSRRQSDKKTILKHFLKRNFKRKIISAKIEKICWQFTFAALMQPFQYDLRSSAAKDNSITHAAAAPSNLDAATTMRFATIMQPFQCDLPPQLQETHRTTHTGTTTRCKTHRRNNSRQKRPQPQPPHRRGTFHRRLQPLYTEKHKVSCSGFLPNTKPMQHHAAIPMRSATTASRNA